VDFVVERRRSPLGVVGSRVGVAAAGRNPGGIGTRRIGAALAAAEVDGARGEIGAHHQLGGGSKAGGLQASEGRIEAPRPSTELAQLRRSGSKPLAELQGVLAAGLQGPIQPLHRLLALHRATALLLAGPAVVVAGDLSPKGTIGRCCGPGGRSSRGRQGNPGPNSPHSS